MPGSCDKTRGAETLSAAAGAQLALLLKSCSVRFAHALAKLKFKKKKRWAGGPNFEPGLIRSKDPTFCAVFIK